MILLKTNVRILPKVSDFAKINAVILYLIPVVTDSVIKIGFYFSGHFNVKSVEYRFSSKETWRNIRPKVTKTAARPSCTTATSATSSSVS